jgi:radical SAM-linked protein
MIVRMRFTKHGKVRFTSHRDVARIFERAVRRARLPIAYTEGFSPRPKMSFGLALSTGHESEAEYLDMHLLDEPPTRLADVPALLDSVLPHGITPVAAVEIERPYDSLQEAVQSCTWLIEAIGLEPEAFRAALERAMASTELPITRTRKGKEETDDVRPAMLAADGAGPTERGMRVVAELATQPRACRPAEFLRALDPSLTEGHVVRTNQWIHDGDVRREPIELAPSSSGHATERVS